MKKILTATCFLLATLYASAQKDIFFQQKVKVLKRFFEQNHYQPRVWDDSSSAMLYNKWIGLLDDDRLYFTQKEISQLDGYKYQLDDELAGKSWKFFDLSVALYQASLKRADSIITKVTDKAIDISRPDNITWPLSTYAASNDELTQRWQRYIKWQILGSVADEQVSAKKELLSVLPADFAKLEVAARQKRRKYLLSELDELLEVPAELLQTMQENYLNTIAWCYDPHSSYMSITKKKEWDTEISASEYSAGFTLEKNEKGEIAVGFLQPGGSAWRSGQLHKGDVLLKIKSDGKEKQVDEMDRDELNNELSGSSASDIEVTVRTSAAEVKTIRLSKEKISNEESIVKSYVLHGKQNIGYINLPGFYSREEEGQDESNFNGCANDVSKEIVKLKKDTIAGLILDLRYNGGGSMWEGMQLAGIFIDAGPVASVKEKDGKVHFLKDPNRGTIYDGPLVVLINGASASASEFVSAALQDYNRAIIIGGNTYGKGTAQLVLPMDTTTFKSGFNYTDFIKVTQRKFYRVNGGTTQWKGVTPDILLPDTYADASFKEKANASALQPDNSKTGIYQPLAALPVGPLKIKSEQRVVNDPYFKGIADLNVWIGTLKSGRNIPLQWDSYVTHYKRTKDMFEKMKGKDQPEHFFSVTNNGFDRGQLEQSGEQRQKVNETYLKNAAADKELGEAYRILLDWNGK